MLSLIISQTPVLWSTLFVAVMYLGPWSIDPCVTRDNCALSYWWSFPYDSKYCYDPRINYKRHKQWLLGTNGTVHSRYIAVKYYTTLHIIRHRRMWIFGWVMAVIHELVHYTDVKMGAIASQITSLTFVYSTVCSDADQRKHQSFASLAFVRGIHRGPVNSPHKWPVTRKMFSFDDVIM